MSLIYSNAAFRNQLITRNIDLSSNKAMIIVIALYAYSMGAWGFWDLLGIKKTVIGLLTVVFSSLFPFYCRKLKKDNLMYFLFLLTTLACALIFNYYYLFIFSLIVALLIVIVINNLSMQQVFVLSRYLTNITFFFAVLHIVLFIVLLISQSSPLIKSLFIDSADYTEWHFSAPNSLALLGLTDGSMYHIGKLIVPRGRGFATEPSLLFFFYLFPAAISLFMRRKWNARIIIFAALISFSGTVFFVFVLTGVIYVGYRILKNIFKFSWNRYMVLFGMLLLLFMSFFVIKFSKDFLISHVNTLGELTHIEAFSKGNSAITRINIIVDNSNVWNLLTARPEPCNLPAGLLISVLIESSIVGVIFLGVFLVKFCRNILTLFSIYNIACAYIIAILLTTFMFISGMTYPVTVICMTILSRICSYYVSLGKEFNKSE
jgi:hypothetical protein